MLVITAIAIVFNLFKAGNQASADGVVVDVVKQRELIDEEREIYDDFHYPVIRFRAEDGRTRTVEVREGSTSPYYEPGDKVTVLYDREHPLDARIKSFGTLMADWILPLITGFLGMVFGGIGLLVRKYLFAEETIHE